SEGCWSGKAFSCWRVATRAIEASAAVLPSVHSSSRSPCCNVGARPSRSPLITPIQRPRATIGTQTMFATRKRSAYSHVTTAGTCRRGVSDGRWSVEGGTRRRSPAILAADTARRQSCASVDHPYGGGPTASNPACRHRHHGLSGATKLDYTRDAAMALGRV